MQENPEQTENEEEKAVTFIRRVTKAATGQDLAEEEAREIFRKAKDRLFDAMAQAKTEGR